MQDTQNASDSNKAGWLDKSKDYIWQNVIIGDSKFNPEKSAYDLAKEYTASGKTPLECAQNFVKWQTSKAGLAGFALGLPGGFAMAATIPADFAATTYLQLRMIAVIGILFGWDTKSDQLRTVAFGCLLGTMANESVRNVGVQATNRFGIRFVKQKISGESLKRINKYVPNLVIKGSSASAKTTTKVATTVGGKVATRGAQKGLINLTKMVPLLGGVVGGGANAFSTRAMGFVAIKMLKDGPPTQDEEIIIEDFDITESVNVAELKTFMENMSESNQEECEPDALTNTPKADHKPEVIPNAKKA